MTKHTIPALDDQIAAFRARTGGQPYPESPYRCHVCGEGISEPETDYYCDSLCDTCLAAEGDRGIADEAE